MPANTGYTLSIDCILREAKFRWLKGYEVLCILQNYQQYGLHLSPAAPIEPQSGSLYLFNKRLVKFRKDGINWRKQKDGKTVRESHEKLKVGGIKVLSCCYTRSSENPAFQRRIYWLLDGDPTTVLVHYLLLDKEQLRDDAASGLELSMDEYDTPVLQKSSIYLVNDNNEDEDREGTGSDSCEEDGDYVLNSGSSPSFVNSKEPAVDFVNSFISPADSYLNESSSLPYANPYGSQDLSSSAQSSSCPEQYSKITDFSPEWDYVDGGSKILIMGPEFHHGLNYYVMFDTIEVPAELVTDGVLRCRSPPHYQPGYVNFAVTKGNFVQFSEMRFFEFKTRETVNEPMSMNERNFKLRIIERLEHLEREANFGCSVESVSLSESIMDCLSQTLEDKYLTEEQMEDVFVKILVRLMEGIDHKDTLDVQDRDGLTLLHYACALRYTLLAATLITYGANVNIQDRSGNTPFHWAMKNRDQKMIKTLVDYVDLNRSPSPSTDSAPATPDYYSPYPSIGTPTMDGIINGIDGLGIPECEASSPMIRKLRGSRDSSSPLTPLNRVRHNLRSSRDDEPQAPHSPFQSYRERRMEKVEEETKRRTSRARDSVLLNKRR